MKNSATAFVVFLLLAGNTIAQTDTTKPSGGFAQHGAVTGFALLGSGFYEAVYDSGVFPISGPSLSAQIPGSDNVIISFTSGGNALIAGIDALDSTDANHRGTDGGVWQYSGSWSKIGVPSTSNGSTGLPSHSVTSVARDTTYVFVGLPGSDLKSQSPSFGGVWRAIPGNTWNSCYSGPMTDSSFVTSLLWSESTLYAGTLSSDMPNMGSRGLGNGGIFKSTDHGTTWTDISYDLSNRDIVCIAQLDTMIYVSTLHDGVFRKALGAESWTQVAFNTATNPVSCFATDGSNLYAGTYCIDTLNAEHGVYYINNNSTSWNALSVPGLRDSTIISALGVYGGHLYVGSGGTFGMTSKYYGTFVVSLVPVAVRPSSEASHRFMLGQNYPNPFNPSTIISYQLPANIFVSLKIYDVLGREVKTFVNGRQNAGTHNVTFNAGNLSSGVYFYRLTAGSFSEVKKLLLVK